MKILSNIKYLFETKLKKELEFLDKQSNFDYLLDNLKYELYEDIKNLKVPNIKNVDETLDVLLTQNSSICRFGDGEFMLMQGRDIPFQKASKELERKLIEILKSDNDNIKIAIPHALYHSKHNLTNTSKDFWRNVGPNFRLFLSDKLNKSKEYLSSEVSLAYTFYENYNFEKYFNKIRKIWNNKEIVIICGNTIFNNIQFNIFDNAKQIEYLYTLSKNAYDEYENILKKAIKIDKNKIVILICGPTAKVLAYDLTLVGYRALDLGHIAKSYDFYKRQKKIDNQKISNKFFSPD